jgi:hypothetical protein
MGRGNFLPSSLEGEIGYEMIYIPIPETQEYDGVFMEVGYDDFKEQLEIDILEALPKSFKAVQKWIGERYIVAQNGVTDVYLADNQWSLALVIHPRFCDYFPNHRYLAIRHLSPIYKRIVEKLKEYNYELSVRTSAWTSAPI